MKYRSDCLDVCTENETTETLRLLESLEFNADCAHLQEGPSSAANADREVEVTVLFGFSVMKATQGIKIIYLWRLRECGLD